MRMQPLPLPDGSYADEARPWTAQDVINWIPTQAESSGTRTPTKYMTPPGLRPFVQAGTGPVRGTYNAEGRLLAVIGKMLYRISNTGVAIPIGTVPGVSRVAFAHNQITSGNEVLVVNGSAGYVYNTVEDSFERITDEGYPGGISATFIDGYLLQIEPARRYAFHSDLADAMSYNTLDRFTSEYRPDLLVALASSNNELILFSETSYEVFENTGASQQPFRSRQITGDKGCASRYGVAVMDQRVLWLADDGMFYAMEGYAPKRISTRAIEQSILGLNWGQAFAEVWEEAGHSICYWTFPDGMTWGWDASTGKWHRRRSYEMKRWRANSLTKWGQKWIAGDFQGPRLWTVDRDYMLEGDIEFVSEVTTGVIHNNQNRVVMPRLEVIMDAGRDETIAVSFPEQPEGPQIEGDAPNSVIGATYNYAYTVTQGTSPIESVQVVSGALPDGLTLSNTGVITGTPTQGGEFTITVRVTDTVGLWDEVIDTIEILSEQWWASFTGPANVFNSIKISNTNAETWGDATVDSIAEMTNHYGPKQIGSKVIFVGDTVDSDLAFFSDPTFVTTELSVTQTSVIRFIKQVRYIDGIALLIAGDNGIPSMYSVNDGASWDVAFEPALGEAMDINRVGDTWVTVNEEVSGHFYYTDEPLPINWVMGNATSGSHYVIASNGSVAVSFDNISACRRTNDGISWSTITVPSHGVGGPSNGDCLAVGDVFLFSRTEAAGLGNITLLRSTDAGLNWHIVIVAAGSGAIRRLERSKTGRIVASCNALTGIAYYSDDDGATWLPTLVGVNNYGAAPIDLELA